MLNRFLFLLCVCAFLLVGCKETPKLENFDSDIWKKDKLACKNQRKDLVKSILQQKEKLKRLGQNQIIKILGRPDFQELQNRNQRTYIYFYEKGEPCQTPNSIKKYADLSTAKILKIRFNATDMVNEVFIQE
jgi:hypothetical protein